MPSFYIECHSCPRRRLDAERIREFYRANGHMEVETAQAADWIVLVTCGLKRPAEKAARAMQAIAGCGGRRVVYGCLPAMAVDAIRGYAIDAVVPTAEIESFDSVVEGVRTPMSEVPDARRLFQPKRAESRQRPTMVDVDPSAASIRIAWGCRGRCAYCAIRSAIGPLRSKSVAQVLAEIRTEIEGGTERVNLLASDSGAYGLDIGSDLPTLLKDVFALGPALQVAYIQDLHPAWLIRYADRLAEAAATGRVHALLTAIQSGSARVLRRMRRAGDPAAFEDALQQLREAHPEIRTRTQIIVGFPGEVRSDVDDTRRMLERCRFDRVDIFSYHESPGVDSLALQPKVPPEEIRTRMALLKDELPPETVGSVS